MSLSPFQVEASRWTKHEGALPGVDYAAAPDEWQFPNTNIPAGDRESAWNAFEQRPISRAEAGALREIRISRGRERGGFGSTGRLTTGDGSLSKGSRMMPYLLIDIPRSSLSREADAGASTCRRHPATDAPDPQLPEAPMLSLGESESRQQGADVPTEPSAKPGKDHHSNACSGVIGRDGDSPVSACSSGGASPPSEFEFKGDDPPARLGLGTRSCELPSIPPASLLAPSSGFGMVESAFDIRGEADVDSVLRAMMRLSESKDEILNEPRKFKRQQREAYVNARGRAATKFPPSGAARDRPAGGLIKGTTLAIKSKSCGQLLTDDGKPSIMATEVTHIAGRVLRREERVIARGSRKSTRRVRTTEHSSPIVATRDRKSAPHKRRDRSVSQGPTFVPVLSNSAIAPRIGMTQPGRNCSTVSLDESLMSFGFARTRATNPVVSSASQPSNSSCAGSISDLPSDSIDLRRCDVDQRGSSCSGVSRDGSVQQQQQRLKQPAARACTLSASRGGQHPDSSARSKSRRPSNGKIDLLDGKLDPRNGKHDPVNGTHDSEHGKIDPRNGESDPGNGKLGAGMKKNRLSVDRSSPFDEATAADGGHTSDADDKTTGEQMSVIIADVTRNAASSLSAELTEISMPSPVEGPRLLPLPVKIAKVSAAMSSRPAPTTAHKSFAHTTTVTSPAGSAPHEQSDVGQNVPTNTASGGSIRQVHLSAARGVGGNSRAETKDYCTTSASPSDPQAAKAAADPLRYPPKQETGGTEESVEVPMMSSRGNRKSAAANEQVVAGCSLSRTLPPALVASTATRNAATLQVGDNASGVFVDGGQGQVGNHQSGVLYGGKPHSSPTEPKHRADKDATGAGGASLQSVKRSRLDVSNTDMTSESSPRTPGSSTSSRSTRTSSSSGSSNKNRMPPHQSEKEGHARNDRRAKQVSPDYTRKGECKDPKTDILPKLARRGGVVSREQGVHGHRPSTTSASITRTAAEGLGRDGGDGVVGALPVVSSGKVGDASRRRRTGAAASINSFSGGRDVKVHRRPVRVESKDLKATTEALTTHRLTVDDLLKVNLPKAAGMVLRVHDREQSKNTKMLFAKNTPTTSSPKSRTHYEGVIPALKR